DGGERRGHELARRRENQRRIERLVRPLVRAARPDRAELAGERLRLDVAGAGKGVELELPVSDDLRNDVRGGPESIHADSGGIAGLAQRAVADQTRAEQRRRRDRIVRLGNREAEIFVRYGVLGVAARQLIPREERVRTEILLPGSAVAAPAAGPSEPWNADSLRSEEHTSELQSREKLVC